MSWGILKRAGKEPFEVSHLVLRAVESDCQEIFDYALTSWKLLIE